MFDSVPLAIAAALVWDGCAPGSGGGTGSTLSGERAASSQFSDPVRDDAVSTCFSFTPSPPK